MWKWIRIPKGLALAAFLLPWMTVSCSNQKFAEASGFGLAFGNISFMGQAADRAPDGALNILLILALLAIGGGIFLLFARGREMAKWVLATSVAALLLIFAGTNRYSKDAIGNQVADGGTQGSMDQAALAMIQVNWEFGYWLAILSLIAAAVMAWLVMAGKEEQAEAKMRSLASDVADGAKVAAAKANEAAKAAAAKADDAMDNLSKKDDPPNPPPSA